MGKCGSEVGKLRGKCSAAFQNLIERSAMSSAKIKTNKAGGYFLVFVFGRGEMEKNMCDWARSLDSLRCGFALHPENNLLKIQNVWKVWASKRVSK